MASVEPSSTRTRWSTSSASCVNGVEVEAVPPRRSRGRRSRSSSRRPERPVREPGETAAEPSESPCRPRRRRPARAHMRACDARAVMPLADAVRAVVGVRRRVPPNRARTRSTATRRRARRAPGSRTADRARRRRSTARARRAAARACSGGEWPSARSWSPNSAGCAGTATSTGVPGDAAGAARAR